MTGIPSKMSVLVENPSDAYADIVEALRDLDARIEALDFAIWIGGEPTFTDRLSEAPEWLYNALGGDKEARARELLRGFAASLPGCALLRTLGRQYPGEPAARWSLGLLALRSGEPLWRGPPDPLLLQGACPPSPDLSALRQALLRAFTAQGWGALPLDSPQPPVFGSWFAAMAVSRSRSDSPPIC